MKVKSKLKLISKDPGLLQKKGLLKFCNFKKGDGWSGCK